MFEHLRQYRVILVTGPHRSGTTICARMVAEDTGHEFVIEDDIQFSNGKHMRYEIDKGKNVVVQCPFFLPEIELAGLGLRLDDDEFCVVMMHRYRRDIEESEERAPVNFDMLGYRQKCLYGHAHDPRHVSDVKYEAWETQRKSIKHTYDVGYLSLADHPLWDDDHKNLKFQHRLGRRMPKGFMDGLNLTQDL